MKKHQFFDHNSILVSLKIKKCLELIMYETSNQKKNEKIVKKENTEPLVLKRNYIQHSSTNSDLLAIAVCNWDLVIS